MSIKRLQIWLDKQLKEGFNSIKNGRVNIYIYSLTGNWRFERKAQPLKCQSIKKTHLKKKKLKSVWMAIKEHYYVHAE